MDASASGSVTALRSALASGADVSVVDEVFSLTALMHVVVGGADEVCLRMLLDEKHKGSSKKS